MTTESADAHRSARVPPPSAVPRPAAAVRPPRGPGRETLPPPRPGRGVRRRTVAPLLAVDALATAATALLVLGPGTAPTALGLLLAGLLLLHSHAGLYRPGPAPRTLNDLPTLLGRSAVCWCAAAAVLAAVRPGQALPPALLVGAVAVHTALGCGGRAAVHRARRAAARRRPRATLIVGTGPAARQLAAVLHTHPEYGMRPVGVVTPPSLPPAGADAPSNTAGSNTPPGPAGPPLPRLGSAQDITRAVIQHTVRDVVFTLPPYGDPHTTALLRRFIAQGSAVWLAGAAAAREGRTPHADTDHLRGFACRLLDTAPPRHGGGSKRLLDLTLAASGLVVTAPVLLGCALAVRLAVGPGVLFRQERIGRGGRSFTLLKFRTWQPCDEHEAATRWSLADESRMSRVGRLLRRTSLDELPQLWNVLRGEMSLVGPRPERPFFVERFLGTCPDYGARLRMPAGMTGLAQVHGLRGDTSVEDRVRFDNLYIDSWSLRQDLLILLRTVASVVRLEGR
ncbi:exopolysaccharide biosynthesis polyprenyl glycosylphosphotransferase [Streptomyces sp. NEAU-S7GS2]|uniref:exopolysaccharide biosynthesis polyprenyl glycosylphosphotransferase n=1 Tax=Streptomyces sp. NEAU-S7GS2 TaxID=2202000 RepID=UPI000D6FD8D6|nr:exopolysaccharide biosynthesis polyprenyl glycosylphosphotransferase [Streptomyces sp. NEAU-S7GS2]AWN27383.1 sugar transferase [Streptomyces sp. NEAU-S7GS2]